MHIEPKLYLTHDKDGIHLWFATGAPIMRHGIYHHDHAASKTRLPLSWFEKVIPKGDCKSFDVFDLFTASMQCRS